MSEKEEADGCRKRRGDGGGRLEEEVVILDL